MLRLSLPLLSFLLCADVLGQVVTTEDGLGADTFVTSTAPTTNYGGEEHVTVKNDSGTGKLHRKSYVRFDLSGVREQLTGATLELTFYFASVNSPCSSDFDIYGLVDLHPGEMWDESAVAWNTAPANTGGGTGLVADEVTHLGTLTLPICDLDVGDLITFTTPELVSFLDADTDGLATLIIVRKQANLTNQCFASKEHATFSAPRLRLDGYGSFCYCSAGPCGNSDPGAGCVNSTGMGARLAAQGSASISADDLVLSATVLPGNAFGLLFMGGGTVDPGTLGDGLLCVSPGPQSFCRFPVRNSGPTGQLVEGPGIVGYSLGLEEPCHIQAGSTWHFQAWFRDPNGPCGQGFNSTNGISVTFGN